MSKRRINKQQTARIERIQKQYHDNKTNALKALADGLVITRFSREAEIEDQEGRRIRCSIRPNLDALVAGDRVIWQAEGTNQGVVVSLYPRKSVLARIGAMGVKKPVAANITQLVIVIAPKPLPSWPLLDSYLVMAKILNLQAVIVLNKTDLDVGALKCELLSDYKNLMLPFVFTSHTDRTGFENLRKVLNHEVNVFVGQSGVGKSSLIRSLLPHEETIATKALSEGSELGQHTTSHSRFYHLQSGGALIDSPGVREFSLWTMTKADIANAYPEFLPFIPLCKYRNCLHIDTPHCAIIQALNQGLISKKRYENFKKLSSQFGKQHDAD